MTRLSPLVAYAVSLLVVAVAVALRLALDPVLDDRLPFILPFGAMVFAAWYGGRGPGLVALVAGALATIYLILEPRYGPAVGKTIYLIGLVMYSIVGLAVILMMESLRQTVLRADEKLKLLRASEAFNRAVLESSPDCLKVLDTSGRLLMMNGPGRAVMQIDDFDAMIGRHWHELWPEEGRAQIIDAVNRARTGELCRFEGQCPTAKGVPKWWDVVVAPVWDGKGAVDKIVATSRDITEGKRVEERLRQVADELSQADRRKDEFLATLSHELRNPLAPLRNCLDLMKRANGNAELLEQARSTMDRQVGQMVRLIDDLLDVSRITRDRLELKKERVELASIVHHAVEACQPFADAAGHELQVTLPARPVYLDADPVRLAQVFGNLLTNACKYTRPGGKIWLTAIRHGDTVSITVRDTGEGMPPEMLPHIFELFTQVDRSLDRSQGGLGIGLALVKRLVELHGGTVSGHSDGLGEGSEFTVRLPLPVDTLAAGLPAQPAPAGEQAVPVLGTQPEADTATTATGRRVLVVDDNRDNAQSLASLLQLGGDQTRVAFDGGGAIELAASFRPDVILLDLGLPTISGYQVCSTIRSQPGGHDPVIVAMTGWGRQHDREKTRRAGFDDHLVKPVDHAVLMESIERLCAARPA